jgi:hypothetical protein
MAEAFERWRWDDRYSGALDASTGEIRTIRIENSSRDKQNYLPKSILPETTCQFSVLPRFAQLQKVFLRMGANLHNRSRLNQTCNLLPPLPIKLKSFDK